MSLAIDFENSSCGNQIKKLTYRGYKVSANSCSEVHNGEAVTTCGVYKTQRHSESSAFLSAVEQEVTKLTQSETPSSAIPFSSSRYSTFSLRRLSKPPEETKPP